MPARRVVQQSGNACYACWSFICLPHFRVRFFFVLSSSFSMHSLNLLLQLLLLLLPIDFSLPFFFLAVVVFVCDFDNLQLFERNARVNGEERASFWRRCNTAQWGRSEKTSKRRAINGINRSPSSRQRAHINSTPGNTCVLSFHHARTMTPADGCFRHRLQQWKQ